MNLKTKFITIIVDQRVNDTGLHKKVYVLDLCYRWVIIEHDSFSTFYRNSNINTLLV